MIIDLQMISRSPRHFDLTFHDDWWRQSEGDARIQGLEGPLKAKLHVSRDGEGFFLSGRLTGKLRLVCDRCLDLYCCITSHDFRLELSPPEHSKPFQTETELETEDMAIEFIETTNIDLDDIIREQIHLSLPIKTLCTDACAGLCPRCGVNLNRETCRCKDSSGHPAFQELKNLRIS